MTVLPDTPEVESGITQLRKMLQDVLDGSIKSINYASTKPVTVVYSCLQPGSIFKHGGDFYFELPTCCDLRMGAVSLSKLKPASFDRRTKVSVFGTVDINWTQK
jgi:hypothetical protein